MSWARLTSTITKVIGRTKCTARSTGGIKMHGATLWFVGLDIFICLYVFMFCFFRMISSYIFEEESRASTAKTDIFTDRVAFMLAITFTYLLIGVT